MCALVLVAHAAAAAKQAHPATNHQAKSHHAKRPHVVLSPAAKLQQALVLAHKERGAVAFFANHRSLLASTGHGQASKVSLRLAERRLARTESEIARLRHVLRAREARRLEALPPKAAICDAFAGYCGQAIQVAWCESRLDPNARNGQYLGLFQMGSYARQLYGHGRTPHEQAVAAHRYFLSSGRDWSPWSCKPSRW